MEAFVCPTFGAFATSSCHLCTPRALQDKDWFPAPLSSFLDGLRQPSWSWYFQLKSKAADSRILKLQSTQITAFIFQQGTKKSCAKGDHKTLLCPKEPACQSGDARDTGSIAGLGRSPREGNRNPLQYPCLKNPMDTRAWQATVHWVAKSQT